MAEVKLWCGVYGEGNVFPVEIERNATVSDLQDVIFDKMRFKERYSFGASMLKLYLARKDGAWMKDDASLSAFLHGEVDKQLVEMDPHRSLDEEEYFGEGLQPGEEEIHVLVELPEAAVGVVSEPSPLEQIAKDIKELREDLGLNKRKRYVHSEMSLNKGSALLRELRIRVEPVDTVPFTTRDPTPVQAFEWESARDEHGQTIAVADEQQRERYLAYVEDNIGDVLAEKKLCVVGVEKDKNILNATVPGHDIHLVGRADILVLSALAKKFPHYVKYLHGVKMLIEVKSAVNDSSDFQALSELIALEFLVDEHVMALLTNLTDHWRFFWVSEKRNNHAIIQTMATSEPGEAFEVIKTLLAQSSSADGEISLPICERPVKRRKLAEVLPDVSEDRDGSGSVCEGSE